MHPANENRRITGNKKISAVPGHKKGTIVDATSPPSIPKKYPYPLRRHQIHFSTFAAAYPPYREEVIQRVRELIDSAKNPMKTPMMTRMSELA